MAAARPAGRFAAARLRLTGVAFLAVILGLVLLTVALYNKDFTPVVHVSLKADRIGNQLSAPADVKIRGLIVGEVRGVHSTGDGATLDLALQPDKVAMIPRNVEARLLPKTLFGEKYVSLVTPVAPAGPISEGDVIPQDRSTTSIETEKVLDDLVPLLKALKPDDLSRTLNALSGALRGRGDRLGQNAVLTDRYFKRLNPALPTIQKDLVGLADLADTYDAAAPDLLAVLDNFSFSSRSLVEQQQQFASFLKTSTTFAGSFDSILRQNDTRLVTLARDSVPSLNLYARYSPEFDCMLTALDKYGPTVGSTFGGLQPGLHITLEQTKDQGGYVHGEEPKYRDTRGPNCRGNPTPKTPARNENFADGYRDGSSAVRSADADAAVVLSSPQDEHAALGAVVAPVLGVDAAAVPDLVDLLFAPMARGTTVGLK